jgi:rhamnosyltransferase
MVTYNGAETVGQTLRSCFSTAEQRVGPVLVVDNGSSDGTVGQVESLPIADLELMRLPRNVGVAKAYNLGLCRARQTGKEWLFLLDQDSICADGCPGLLLQTGMDLAREGGKVGGVCPTSRSHLFPELVHYPLYWSSFKLEPVCSPAVVSSNGPVAIDSCNSSGTLYRVEALTDIGGFNEDYFIDFVDHECHLRLRRAGWSLWWDRRAELYHRLGTRQKILKRGVWIEHAPYRYYYMARNMFDTHRRFGGPRSLFSLAGIILRHMYLLSRHGQNPQRSICWILKGLEHGILGKFGPRAPER